MRCCRALVGSLLLCLACGDDSAPAGGSTGGGSGSTADSPGTGTTTPQPGTTTGPGSTSVDPDSSGGTTDDSPPNEPPTAVAVVTPTSGLAPLRLSFDGSQSSDVDGDIVGHDWVFPGGEASGAVASGTVTELGCHDITLTVTDDQGATAEASAQISVVSGVPAEPLEGVVLEAPLDGAVLPRDVRTNEGTAHFSGMIDSEGYAEVRARVTGDAGVVQTVSVPLCGAPPIAFDIDVPISAELEAYDIELFAATGETEALLGSSRNLVAGDIYLVNGQSNAFAFQYGGDANVNQGDFVRSFGSNVTDARGTSADLAWRNAEGNTGGGPGGIGQWAIRMAGVLSETHQVPIAVVNGALGGQPIGYFQRDDGDPANLGTNYGRLLTRMQAAGIHDDVRAILWYQGESDGPAFDVHQLGFEDLLDAWSEDFPGFGHTYVTQIRAGCGGDIIRTQEVQRQFAEGADDISVMSTTALDGHDGCHYTYAEGYEELGDRYAALLGRDLYGVDPASDVDAPSPVDATFEAGGTEVVVTMRNAASVLTVDAGVTPDFQLEGSGVVVTGAVAEAGAIRLTLSGDGTGATGLTYLGHVGAGAWITNENGIGLLTFWSLPIE